MLSRLSTVARNGSRASQMKHALQSCIIGSKSLSTGQPSKDDAVTEAPAVHKSAWELYKEKAGESGATMLGVGLAAYALSKEILVIHEETLLAAVMAGTIMWLSKKAGPGIAQALDARSDEILENMNKGRVAQISALEAEIAHEKNTEAALETRAELFEVVKENNEMRLELEYRRRLLEVETEVAKRLNYQVDLQQLNRNIEQQHIASWVESEVIKSITPQLEKEAIAQCIADIDALAESRAA